MNYSEKEGDIFAVPTNYAIINCITQDCDMNSELEKRYIASYPDMKTVLQSTIRANKLCAPFVIHYKGADTESHEVFNLFLKKTVRSRLTYDDVRKALNEVLTICKTQNISCIALGKIGCITDKLNWDIVKDILQDVFKESDLTIEVRY